MNKICDKCQIGEIENDRCWWCSGYFPPSNNNNQGERTEASLYFPTSDYSFSDKKSYEMKRIHPSGKGSDKYYWFICTPNFPSEQYKVNDPHCHARKNDWSGEARISLEPSSHEPTELKVKIGKISGPDQTEIRKLVKDNKELIYQEWKSEWIR